MVLDDVGLGGCVEDGVLEVFLGEVAEICRHVRLRFMAFINRHRFSDCARSPIWAPDNLLES